jgi:O-antigen/teichoic acid export membrane protein
MKKINLSDKVAYLTVGSSINQLSRLLIVIVVARFVSKDVYGTYNQMFLVFGVLSPIFLAGIPGSLLYFFPNLRSDKKKGFIEQTDALMSILGLLYGILIFIFADTISMYFSNPALATALKIFSLYPFLNFATSTFQSYLVVREKTKIAPLFFITSAFSKLSLIAIFLIFLPTSDGLAMAAVLSQVPTYLFIMVALIKDRINILTGLTNLRWKSVKGQLSYSVPLGLAGMIGIFAYQIDKLLVSLNFTPEVYAIYAVGAFEIPVVALIGQSVNNVLVPEISRNYKDGNYKEISRLWSESLRKMALIIFPIFAVLYILADLVILALFTDKYIESVPLFRIYLYLMPIRIASYGLILRAIGKTKIDFIASIFFLVINFVVSYYLMMAMGLVGPAIGTVITTIVLAMFYLLSIKKNTSLKLDELLPVKKLFSVAMAVAIPGLVVWGIRSVFDFKNINLFVSLTVLSAAYMVVYTIILVNSNMLNERDKSFIIKWLGLGRILNRKG